jgi:Phage major capsid protein E
MPGNPTIRDGHVDVLLTNISVAYIQDAANFVAGQVFPPVPVEHASDLYLKYNKGSFFRDDVKARPFGGLSGVTGFDLTKATYYCEEQALSTYLDDRERANATPPYDPERGKTLLLTSQHMIHRDIDWSRKFFTTGVWTGGTGLNGGSAGADYTGVSTAPGANGFLQFDQAASTPIELVDQCREQVASQTGFLPNVLVLGTKVFRALKNHPEVLDRVKYTQRGLISEDLLASLFGIDKVIVPRAIKNTAHEGQTDSMSFIHSPTSMLLAYAAGAPGLEQPTAGYIFSWTGLLGDAAFNAGVWRGRDEQRHSDWFEVRMAYDPEVVGSDLAIFFASCTS